MKIAICEDEDKYAEQLIEYINEWAASKDITAKIFAHITAERFLHEWEDSEDYDMIFLDIKMGAMSGMDLAKIIRRTNAHVPIVFATSMKGQVLQGYTVSAMQFLLKPVRKEDVFACLNKTLQLGTTKKFFLLNDLEKTFKIPHEDILYVEMLSHNATMTTTKQEYTFRKTITAILEELDDDLFVKCHKSYIINIRHIEAVSKTYVIMSNDAEIPLSRNISKEINDKFMKYNVGRVR